MKELIFIIGFMGSGKSSIGKKLAKDLSYAFYDMDIIIEKNNNMTINEIFDLKGEQYFRIEEEKLLYSFKNKVKTIVSCGGGVIKKSANLDFMKNHAEILFLEASPEQIYNNLKKDKTRPLLNVENKYEKIVELLSEREELYNKAYTIKYNVNNKSINTASQEIIKILRGKYENNIN